MTFPYFSYVYRLIYRNAEIENQFNQRWWFWHLIFLCKSLFHFNVHTNQSLNFKSSTSIFESSWQKNIIFSHLISLHRTSADFFFCPGFCSKKKKRVNGILNLFRTVEKNGQLFFDKRGKGTLNKRVGQCRPIYYLYCKSFSAKPILFKQHVSQYYCTSLTKKLS